MLCLGQSLIGKQVLSLRTGAPVAQIVDVIIDPNNLKIEAWETIDVFNKHRKIVLGSEVRDILPNGIVVNDHEALSDPHDLIRLKPVLELQFELIGKPVISNHKRKLGKVDDYAFDKDSLFIQKMYVSQPLRKVLSGGALMIDRSQIVEITNKKVVIREATVEKQSEATAPALAQ